MMIQSDIDVPMLLVYYSNPIASTSFCVTPVEQCPLCGGTVRYVKCKIICTRCPYVRDCSDP